MCPNVCMALSFIMFPNMFSQAWNVSNGGGHIVSNVGRMCVAMNDKVYRLHMGVSNTIMLHVVVLYVWSMCLIQLV